jgi:mono/diheme cytochrome c family protein
MKRLVLSLCMLLMPLCGLHADDAGMNNLSALAPMSGEQIYAHICAGCHMPGGSGATGAGFYPKLAGNNKFVSWEYVAIRVLNGRNGMPPFGLPPAAAEQTRAIQLSDAQVAAVTNYVRSHFGNSYKATVTERQVAALPHPASVAMPF